MRSHSAERCKFLNIENQSPAACLASASSRSFCTVCSKPKSSAFSLRTSHRCLCIACASRLRCCLLASSAASAPNTAGHCPSRKNPRLLSTAWRRQVGSWTAGGRGTARRGWDERLDAVAGVRPPPSLRAEHLVLVANVLPRCADFECAALVMRLAESLPAPSPAVNAALLS
eukprot:2911832-Rhodomonas_salina.1